jgi:hypothetical protein
VRTRLVLATFVALCLVVPARVFADFQYTETTRITGGSILSVMKMAGAFSKQARQANEPTTSTILVKGNRMARINPHYTEIIDLDKETITRIDNDNKTYSVVTFEQMKQQMEEAARKAREEQAKAEKQPQPSSNEPPPQMSFDVKVRNTGASKQVAGLNASETILAMTMTAKNQKTGQSGNLAITNDMYMVPEIPGYSEVRDFQRRLAVKMGSIMSPVFTPQMAAMQPGSTQGMTELVNEMSKLKGVPVLQIMRLGSTANGQPLPAASEAPLPESNSPQMPSAGEVAKESAASAIASKLGGFGGFGGFGHKKKKEEQKQQEQTNPEQAQPQAAVLVQSETETTNFSSAPVDASRFEVPTGYQQVQASSNEK